MKTSVPLILLILIMASTWAHAGRVIVRTHSHRPVVTARVVTVPPSGKIDINCNRKNAGFFVNGKLAGRAGSFDGFPGKLHLRPGSYQIKVVHEGKTYRRRVRVLANTETDLNIVF